MATDRKGAGKAHEKKAPASSQTGKTVTPPPSQESSWIMFSLNRIQEQIDRIEDRLRRFERFVWMTQGVVITIVVVWAVVQFMVSNYQISVTPKP